MITIKNSAIANFVKPRNIIANKPVMKIIPMLIVLVMEISSIPTNEFQALSNIDPSTLLQLQSHSDFPNSPAYDGQDENNHVKRSWQGLQGAWGKRSKNVVDINLEHFDETSNLLNDSGELDPENPEMYNKNNINYSEVYSLVPPENDIVTLSVPKRAWKNMNSGWGKRRSPANDWNKFRGSWGKREPAWNNLKGLWGKRSENWNKLQPAWGKRYKN